MTLPVSGRMIGVPVAETHGSQRPAKPGHIRVIHRIISGGQTGVDRAALDAALELGLETGGWCPRGRKAEDGTIPEHYRLDETPSASYRQRTIWNVRDADETWILSLGELTGGTLLTLRTAQRLGKPVTVFDLDEYPPAEEIVDFGQRLTVNVAGPRESTRPGIYGRAFGFMVARLARYRFGAYTVP